MYSRCFYRGLIFGSPPQNKHQSVPASKASGATGMARAGEGLFKKYLPKNIHEKVC